MARAIAAAIRMVAPEMDAHGVFGRAGAALEEIRYDARDMTFGALQRIGEIPEVESLCHGTAQGLRIEGLRLRDKLFTGAVIGLSAASMMAVAMFVL